MEWYNHVPTESEYTAQQHSTWFPQSEGKNPFEIITQLDGLSICTINEGRRNLCVLWTFFTYSLTSDPAIHEQNIKPMWEKKKTYVHDTVQDGIESTGNDLPPG
jgi:hypothetical protein